MKTIKININYGGYVGCEEEIEVEVEDNATEQEINEECEEAFQEHVLENCYWEFSEEEENEEDN